MVDAPSVPDYYRPKVEESAQWANPAVLGLMGFGTTTILAGMAVASNATSNGLSLYGVSNAPVYAMAIFFGGIAQLIAGIVALRKGEIFPGTAFVGYGSFWLAFVALLGGFSFLNLGPPAGPGANWDVAWFFVVWALFTFAFAINSHKHGVGIAVVFWTLFIAFVLLAADFGMLFGQSATVSSSLWQATGFEIVFTGLAAWWVATGVLTSAHYGGKKVIPY
ncbi:MAG: acetate uptake transporter [Thermoplasmata archaeon]